MKKFLSLLLVVAMLLSMTVTAFAANDYTPTLEAPSNSAAVTAWKTFNGNADKVTESQRNQYGMPANYFDLDNLPFFVVKFDLRNVESSKLPSSGYDSYVVVETDSDSAITGNVGSYGLALNGSAMWMPLSSKNVPPQMTCSVTTSKNNPAKINLGGSQPQTDLYSGEPATYTFGFALTSAISKDTQVTVKLLTIDDDENDFSKATLLDSYTYTFTAPAADPVAKIGDVEYTSLQAAVNAAQSGDIIKLLSDASGNGVDVAGDKNVTFDFDGHTYTLQGEMVGSSGTKTNGFRFLDGSTVTLKNGKLANGATTAEGNTPAKVMVNSYANLTLENFSIDGTTEAVAPSGSAYGTAALYINNKNTVVKGNGTYTGDPDGYVIYMANVEYYSDDAVLTFDKTFTGTVSGKVTNGNKQDYSIAVENGKFAFGDITLGEGAMKLIGGVYTTDVSNYVATGYACVANTDSATKEAYPYVVKAVSTEVAEVKVEDNKIVVDEAPVEVKIEESGATVAEPTQAQLEAVVDEINTIITNPEVATFEDTKIEKATEDLTTQTVQVDSFDISKILNLVKEEAAAKYGSDKSTATAADTITVDAGAEKQFTTADVTTKITVDLTSTKVETTTETAGTQVVSATVSTLTFDVKPVATITVDKGNGQTEVVKAVIKNEDIKSPITFRLPVKDSWEEVRVSHNGIYKGTYFAQGENGNRYVELASNTFSYWTVENNEFEDTDAVAKTGNRYYDDLAEALKDAVNGDTVEVLQNTAINEELFIANKSITLDLGGFTVDVTAPAGKTIPIHIGTKDSSTAAAGLTVKNGTINGTASGNVFGVYGMTTDGSAKRALTLDGVTMNVTGGYAVALNNNSNHGYGAEITIKNSKLTAPYVISVNGNIQDTTGNFPKVKIENSTLKADSDQLAIYAAGYAAWDIEGSNITGGTGLYAKAGTFGIDGGKIEGNGAYAAPVANGGGGDSTGDAIIMDSKTGYAGNMVMDLIGVTVSSVNGYAVHEALTDKQTTSTQSIAIDGGSFTAAVDKAAVVTSEAFDRAETTTLTVANAPAGVTAETDLGKFTSFSVNYGDNIPYGDFSSFLNAAGPVTLPASVNFATMKAGQQLIANFDVTMGTVSYKTGTMTEFVTIHSGNALAGVANDTAITFQIECGSGVTNTFTFTPHWASVEIPYDLAVKPISGDTVTLTVGTDDAPNYVEYGVYASVPNGTTAMAIGSYNFELNYDATAFDFASFTVADNTAAVEVNKDTAGKANVGVTLNTTVTPEVAGETGTLTYSALLGTLKLKVKSNTTATTGVLTTSITNTTNSRPVVTPKGYDDNKGTITTKDHTQYLISYNYVGATGVSSEWILAGKTPTMPTATPNTGWSAGSWAPAAEAAAAPKTYTYTATHVEYTVTWDNSTNPMTVLKGETAINSGDKMYYEDTLSITVTGLTGNKVIRNGDFKYKLGEASATGVNRTGDSGFSYTVGPNVVNANVVLSYTTSEYVTVTFSGGSAVDLMNGETAATDLSAITLKGTADKLYASVNDFIKGNEGTAYSIPNQVPKANARLVPPDAKTDETKQQWKIGATNDTVANSVLTAATPSQVFSADTTLTADAVNTYAVTFVAGSNGSIKTEPTQVTTYNVDEGTSIADILAGSAKDYTDGTAAGTPVVLPQTTPENGYVFKNWTAPVGTTAVNAPTTITGNFEVAKYSIGVSDNAAFKNLTGADATGKISMENDVTFKLMLKKNTRIDSVSYTVAPNANGTAYAGLENQTLTADANGVYTIPKANILGDVTVTVVTKDTVKVTYKLANDAHGTIGGTTVFVVDKGTAWDTTGTEATALIKTPDPGYDMVGYFKDAEHTNANRINGSTGNLTEDTVIFVYFFDGYYQFAFNKLVDTNEIASTESDNIWYNDEVAPPVYMTEHGTDAKFKLAKDANDPQIITSVTYSVEGGVQNVLLQPSTDGSYTIPGDRIIGKVTVTVKTLADEVFEGGETATNKISALFILRDDTMTGVEGSGAYMANVVQNGDMKILALVSEAFKATDYAGTNKFFQLADGTQLYWSDRYDAYVCWVSKTMTSADLDGFVKFDGSKTATAIVNGGDINFDNAVDSADAGIVNDALHGTRQVPTSALQLFEMDVANTSEKNYVSGATIDANDVTWILKNTVKAGSASKAFNPLWAQPE